jgi:DNA end-binding protein Ku
MAKELVNGMTSKWKPEKYKDTYQNDLLKMIKQKIRGGGSIESERPENEDQESNDRQVLDLMPLLKKSLNQRSSTTTKKGKKHARPKRVQKKASLQTNSRTER